MLHVCGLVYTMIVSGFMDVALNVTEQEVTSHRVTMESFKISQGHHLSWELVFFSGTPGFPNCGSQISSIYVTGEMQDHRCCLRFAGAESAF